MKKFLIAAASLSALAAAAPAAAQYHSGYGYGQPQGYAYGYNHHDQHGLVRSYIVRADQLRQRVERLDSRDRITEREARRLRSDAAELQRRARAYANNGLSLGERRDLDLRFARLQQRIELERRDGRGGRWADGRDGWIDRNRNGVDDRYEGQGNWGRDGRDGWIDRNRNGLDDRAERRNDWDRDGRWDGRDGWVDRNRNGIDDRYEQIRRDRDDD